METLFTSGDSFVYTPKAALVVFRSNTGETYLELRDILRDGSMGEGKPVSREFINTLCEKLGTDYGNTLHGDIPGNILYCDPRKGHDVLVWYNPPRRRERHFVRDLGLEDGTYCVPGTVYVVCGKSLYVYCFAGKKVAMDTPLLRGPYFNVYPDGRICTGNVSLEMPSYLERTFENTMTFWENVFWKSIDAHTIDGSPSTKHNLIETIRKYRNTPFDTGELNAYGFTLEQQLRKLKK